MADAAIKYYSECVNELTKIEKKQGTYLHYVETRVLNVMLPGNATKQCKDMQTNSDITSILDDPTITLSSLQRKHLQTCAKFSNRKTLDIFVNITFPMICKQIKTMYKKEITRLRKRIKMLNKACEEREECIIQLYTKKSEV